MALKISILLSLLILDLAKSADIFNYDQTSSRDYGPEDWDEVSCNNLNTCVSSGRLMIPYPGVACSVPLTIAVFVSILNSLDGPTRWKAPSVGL